MNMLQAKKEELKKQGKKGFTLMELLIVVAIIAVLVAIAIPLFTNQLEKSREAVDEANLRDAYAVLVAAQLTNETDLSSHDTDNISYTKDAKTDGYTATVTATQEKTGWVDGKNASIAGVKDGVAAVVNPNTWTVKVDENGVATISPTK